MQNGDPGTRTDAAPRPALRVAALTHRFASGHVALDAVTFAMDAGACVALVGPNGAGKTTLFLRLCGVLAGAPGEAAVNGLDPEGIVWIRDLFRQNTLTPRNF